MMKQLVACAVVCYLSVTSLSAAHPLEGKWLGSIDAGDHGQMQFGLELKDDHGKLVGMVKTAHGDWAVKSVTDEKGTFVVTFDNGSGEGRMKGTIKNGHFTGQWDNRPMATGTFDLAKAAPKK